MSPLSPPVPHFHSFLSGLSGVILDCNCLSLSLTRSVKSQRQEATLQKQTSATADSSKSITMADPFDLNAFQESLNLPFPAATRQASGVVNGIQTNVMCISFSDRILVTVSQKGRLGHWVCLHNKLFLGSTNK